MAAVSNPESGSIQWRGGLLNAPLYTTYSLLYDEMKLEGMKCQLAITSPVGSGAGAYKSLQLYTAIDRKLCYDDMLTAKYPTVLQLQNYSSYIAATALNNNIAKVTRSVYASDLFEKASFADASTVTYASVAVSKYDTTTHAMANGTADILTLTSNNYVPAQSGNKISFVAPAFNPCMYVGVSAPSDTGGAGGSGVTILVDVMYYVTFRNPKYGLASGSAKVSYEERSGYSMDGDDGDMRDGGDMKGAGNMDVVVEAPPDPPPSDDDVVVVKRSVLREAEREAARAKTMDDQIHKRSTIVVPGPVQKRKN